MLRTCSRRSIRIGALLIFGLSNANLVRGKNKPKYTDIDDQGYWARPGPTSAGYGLEAPPAGQAGHAAGVFLTEAQEVHGARCLDGTPGVYFHRKALSSGRNKWLVHHQGGGWCESLNCTDEPCPADSCYTRSLGGLGSTKHDRDSMNIVGGYLDADPAVNPIFYDWNMVFVRYCDGGSFSGLSDEEAQVGDRTLHFRGFAILQGVISHLLAESDLADATDVVISGCSAGGLTTILHLDYWQARIKEVSRSAVTVVGLPDSGFFLEHEDPVKQYRSGLQWQFERFNSTASMVKGCIDAYKPSGEQWKCMFAQHTLPFVQTPIFLLQPRYDSWQARENLHSKDPGRLASWGSNLTKLVQSNFLEQNPMHAAFVDSCSHHCGEWGTLQTPEGVSQPEAFMAWYANISEERHVLQQTWMQPAQYPCLGCCSMRTATWAFGNNGHIRGVFVGLLVAATVGTVVLVSISGNILSRRPVSSKIYGQLPSWMPSWFSPAILGNGDNEIMLKAMN